MSVKLSRRKISQYFAKSLSDGVSSKKLADRLGAYLIDTKRTKEIESIVRDIEYQMGENGIMVVDVISAHGLKESARKNVIDLVKETTGASSIQLRQHLDPSVIGGVRLEFAGMRIDTTISNKLKNLRNKEINL